MATFLSRSAIAFDQPEFALYARVEDADLFPAQQGKHLLRLLSADDKFNHHCHVGGKLEEMLFVQDSVAPEAGDRAKGGPAMDAEFLGLLEQPFEQCHVSMR